MKHVTENYQARWPQDPALEQPELLSSGCTPIAEDEPVLLLRASDKHFTKIVLVYIDCLALDKTMPEETRRATDALLLQHLECTLDWQTQHGRQTPDFALLADGQEAPLGTGRSIMDVLSRGYDSAPAAQPTPDPPQEPGPAQE